ncbi:hypothetical protein B0H11DRAFT_2253892 [Mycena galericulata]|nr:hypothetical protein B0H11DRAFT_2253892 [Mycena galericulata]
MLKFVYIAVLLAAQLLSFYGVSATDALAPGSSFTEAMINLKNAADVFGSDRYNGPFPVNVTALEVIAEHIKDCSDAFDAALIQLAAIPTDGGLFPALSESDAATLNTVYLPSIQEDILAAARQPQWLTRRDCIFRWRGHQRPSRHHSLANHAPSENYTSDWTQLASSTTSQYNIWLAGDGFNCGGAPCWLNGGNA